MIAPLKVLFDATSGDDGLPERLEVRYGGALHLPENVVYSNFVASIDGVAAIHSVRKSSAVISDGYDADRFVMGLLRAAADAVVIGAGTLREHAGPWTGAASYPSLAEDFAELRRKEGRADEPRLVVITASGRLAETDALVGALVLTTEDGARRLGSAPTETEVVAIGGGSDLDVREVVRHLRTLGYRRILTEGGPHLMGDMVGAGAIQELFLTVAPVVAGSGAPGDRSTFTPGLEFLPDRRFGGTLASVRRDGSFVFLRYSMAAERPPG
ncbi:MAG: dihydrofolate reductase family protein [Actinobacteria bacterium]|nr:dihydrofolate reductase family protein [Actinomycetota bacterium]